MIDVFVLPRGQGTEKAHHISKSITYILDTKFNLTAATVATSSPVFWMASYGRQLIRTATFTLSSKLSLHFPIGTNHV